MKPVEMKQRFIELRAEGKSYQAIRDELGIAVGTCSAWEHELASEIAMMKRESLNALYNAYHMTKEARIKKLGGTLNNIDTALEGADLTELTPDKLLDYKLRYSDALRKEYTPQSQPIEKVDANSIVDAMGDLLDRVRAGDITPEQATKESTILTNLLKAYDTVELKKRVDELEAIVGGRA